MRKVTPITEQFQRFVEHVKESFWGDWNGKAQAALQQLLEEDSRRQRDRYLCREEYARRQGRREYRNGYYERDFVTRFRCSGSTNHRCGTSGRTCSWTG